MKQTFCKELENTLFWVQFKLFTGISSFFLYAMF